MVLMLDRPDDATRAVAKEWVLRGAAVQECDEGDLGGARNAAASSVDNEWLAFLDGDDLWSENWLSLAAKDAFSQPDDQLTVWHPAINIIFGDHHSLLHHIDSTDPSFSWARFRLHNAWTALSFVRRNDVLALPYPRNDLANGWGFEDWSWNMAVLGRGGEHRIVADTCHFIRRLDGGSLLASSQAALRSPYPGPIARPVAMSTSELTAADPDLPATHRRAPHGLSASLLNQIGLAAKLEPSIEATVNHRGEPDELPQNFNTHVTSAQQALESLEVELDASPDATIADAVDSADLLAQLQPADQHRVVAEFLSGPHLADRTLGESPLIAATLSAFPQLA